MRDLRFALRQLARTPGFTAAAVVTMALGIGACTAIFSAVDGVLLRPLPFPGPDRLVVIKETLHPQFPEFAVSPRHYLAWRAQATSFENLAAWHEESYNLTGAGEPIRVSAARVTASLFATLGVRPALGREFTSDEDRVGNERVAVLAHGFWQRQLGGRRDVLSLTIELDGQPFTIVGVMPAGFQLDRPLDVFTPAAYPPSGVHEISALGRLKPGVTIEQAQSEMALIATRLDRDRVTGRAWGAKLIPKQELDVRDVRGVLVSLLGAVAFLLLIACVNVANLLLARSVERGREFAVRAALGASRGRIVSQLLTESALLALGGGLLGVALARAGLSALLAQAPDTLPRAADIAIDGRALGFSLALALVTGIGFGLLPAWQATRPDLHRTLKQGGRGASEAPGPRRLRSALVVGEVAIALVLLAGGGLLIRSFAALHDVSPGFAPEGALAVTVSLPKDRYPAGAQQAAFAARAVDQLSAVPGVEAAGSAQGHPFESVVNNVFLLHIADRLPAGERPTASAFSVTPGFFQAMGITLVRGRLFDARDDSRAPWVTVINEGMARRHFAGEDPIGKRIGAAPDRWHQIVGVVRDVRFDRQDGEVSMQAYAPLAQASADWGALTFVVRSPAPDLRGRLRAAIFAVDRNQAITSIRPVSDWIAASMARQRFTMFLFSVFGATALLLAAIGVHGVMAYTVSRRTGEFGVRLALGAQPGDLFRLVLTRAARLVVLGLTLGLAGALLLTRFLAALLFGVRPHDPLTFLAVALLLSLVSAAACLVPARRAARVDPLTALRSE